MKLEKGPVKEILMMLKQTLKDKHFKISLTTLKILHKLFGYGMNNFDNYIQDNFLPLFLEKIGENKIAIRQLTIEILKTCFEKKYIKLKVINEKLLELLKHKNQHFREESLNLITFIAQKKLIKNPKNYLDDWFREISPLIDSKKVKIKIAALHCLGKIVKFNNQKECFKILSKYMTPGGCDLIK